MVRLLDAKVSPAVSQRLVRPCRRAVQPSRPRLRCRDVAVRAADPNPDEPPPSEDSDDPKFGLDRLDPVRLGRQSRQAFDDVWMQFTKLSSPTTSFSEGDMGVFADSMFDFQTPQAETTTILLLGATGTIGRVVLRKLLLRGYKVTVLVRDKAAFEKDNPPTVKVVEGDICDYKKCLEAVQGVDKVVFAAAARSMVTRDFVRVEDEGVGIVLRAFQDYKRKKAAARGGVGVTVKKEIADFAVGKTVETFKVQNLGARDNEMPVTQEEEEGERMWFKGTDYASIELSERKNLHFRGELAIVGSVAEIGRDLSSEENLEDYEGIIIRARGDTHPYSLVLTAGDYKYVSRFPTRMGYSTARLPFNGFRPDTSGSPPLNLKEVTKISLRFENTGKSTSRPKPPGEFDMEVDWIKILPGGQETDYVLISCAGQPRPEMSQAMLVSMMNSKKGGETRVRNSGMGYTIIRATNLLDEPGGYKALVFDQGDRLSQGISAADVADVCVRSLHQPLARNKTFEVAQEHTPEGGLEMYELVAHVPDKSTNYLGAALQNLEKNT
ncbi:hypothetical protein BSKO_03036 [Bryopsis sp. KO-2023]|nr:hypothetical protein BSKO_03036 [Bryopsis sp. KO-2023]